MEPLFEAEFELTLDDVRKMTWIVQRKRILITVLILGAVGFVLGIRGGIAYAVMFTLFSAGFYSVLQAITFFVNTSRAFKARANLDSKYKYKFFEEKFEAYNKNSTFNLEYNKLNSIIETEEYILLMLTKIQGYPLKKISCSKELIEFLQKIK